MLINVLAGNLVETTNTKNFHVQIVVNNETKNRESLLYLFRANHLLNERSNNTTKHRK